MAPLDSNPHPLRSPDRRLFVSAGLMVLALLVIAGGIWGYTYWAKGKPPRKAEGDPRLSYDGLYRNVRPDVAYVGDTACAECHKAQCDSYRQHPMGRSFGPALGGHLADHLDADGKAAFDALGLHYSIERRDGRLYHRETVVVPDGEAASVEVEVPFALGSGTRGASYLTVQDGYVFQSPISWFAQKGVWDLAPGYQRKNEHFDRPVIPECLFCHCDHAEPVTGTINRYQEPLFEHAAIGCERCHGPGQLHVQERREGKTVKRDLDDTIVNPRRLEPALRESVCEQCHLQGKARVVRRGRGVWDYRPGLPLHLFYSVYVFPPEEVPSKRAVGQVEQMYQSTCFKASGGAMGCATCHDPHFLPPQADRVAYYRDRCLNCHEKKGCSLPIAARKEKADDCNACHMPRIAASDVAHTAATDHRILRDPANDPSPAQPSRPVEEIPLILFHRDMTTAEDAKRSRDLGLALKDVAISAQAGAAQTGFFHGAMPLLEEATRTAPDDVGAWEGLGIVQYHLERYSAALAAYKEALAREPDRELSIWGAARAATKLNLDEDAIGYWRRAITINARRWSYHYDLAYLLSMQNQWTEALGECEAALRLSPSEIQARHLQVVCLLELGRKDDARKAFAVLMALKPPEQERLRQWFATQAP
jgi:tetratricopeptide (TPR) repeat protein